MCILSVEDNSLSGVLTVGRSSPTAMVMVNLSKGVRMRNDYEPCEGCNSAPIDCVGLKDCEKARIVEIVKATKDSAVDGVWKLDLKCGHKRIDKTRKDCKTYKKKEIWCSSCWIEQANLI